MKNDLPSLHDRLMGGPGIRLAAVWGFAEGAVFFLVPDILITYVAMFSFRKSAVHVAAVLAGSLAAGALLFLLAAGGQTWVEAGVKRVPFVRERMAADVRRDFERHGAAALLRGPFSGIPYKVYAVEAPRHTGLAAFLVVSIPARLERFAAVWAGFALAGRLLRGRVKWAVALHAVFWVGMYAWYWAVI